MGTLIKFEWKKIWRSRAVWVSLLGCLIFLAFCTVQTIAQQSTFDDRGTMLYGLEAIKVKKSRMELLQGPLTQERVQKEMDEFLEYVEDPENLSQDADQEYLSEDAYYSWYRPKRDLLELIGNTQKSLLEDGILKDVFSREDLPEFYQAREQRMEEYLAIQKGQDHISEAEASYWKNKAQKIRKPYVYQYAGGWSELLHVSEWNILIILVMCIGVAPVIAGEYQSGADGVLLGTKYGKTRLVRAKILASLAYSALLYVGLTLLYSSVILGVIGFEGADASIQMTSSSVPIPWPLTMWQAVLLNNLLGLAATLFMTFLTLLLSALCKTSYAVVIADFLVLIVPLFLNTSMGGRLFQHIFLLLPAKALAYSYSNLTAYSVGGIMMSAPTMIFLTYGVCGILFLFLSGRLFREHQVGK